MTKRRKRKGAAPPPPASPPPEPPMAAPPPNPPLDPRRTGMPAADAITGVVPLETPTKRPYRVIKTIETDATDPPKGRPKSE